MKFSELRRRLGGEAASEPARVTWREDVDEADGGESTATGLVRGVISVTETNGHEEVRLVVDDPRATPMTLAEVSAGIERISADPDDEVTVALAGPDGLVTRPVLALEADPDAAPVPALAALRARLPSPMRPLAVSLGLVVAVLITMAGVTALVFGSDDVDRPVADRPVGNGESAAPAPRPAGPTTTEAPEETAPGTAAAVLGATTAPGPADRPARRRRATTTSTSEVPRTTVPKRPRANRPAAPLLGLMRFVVEPPPARPRPSVTPTTRPPRTRPTTTVPRRPRPPTTVRPTVPPSTQPPTTEPPTTEPPTTQPSEPPTTVPAPPTSEPPPPAP